MVCCLGLITGLLDETFSDSLSRNVTKSDGKNVRVECRAHERLWKVSSFHWCFKFLCDILKAENRKF